MALIKKIKVSVFECRPYETTNAKTGETYTGYTLKAFNEKDETMQFTSPEPMKDWDLGGFDEAHAVEVTLYGRDFQGMTKWSTDKKTPKNQHSSTT